MKMLKILIGLVLLLVVALVVAGFFIDGIAKTAIEDGGSRALGVATTVKGLDIGLLGGTATLKGLRVANPKGFGEGAFLELGEGSVAVSASSLFSDTIRVPELTLSNVRVSLLQALQGSNYGTILDNLKRFQGGGETSSEEGKRFVIDKLLIEDVVVTAAPVQGFDLGKVSIPIDRIELKDVGSESDKGVLLADLSGIVVQAILQRASATGKLPGLVQGALGGKLGGLRGLQDVGAEMLQGLTGGPGDVKKTVGEATKGIGKKLQGLLGK